MEDFKLRFIETAYTKFGIKAIESINFEQAFAILDEMQQCNIANVVGQSEQLCKKKNIIQSLKIIDGGKWIKGKH